MKLGLIMLFSFCSITSLYSAHITNFTARTVAGRTKYLADLAAKRAAKYPPQHPHNSATCMADNIDAIVNAEEAAIAAELPANLAIAHDAKPTQ